MPLIYHVKYNEFARKMFRETSGPSVDTDTWWTFDPRDRYYEIIETKEVPVFLEFQSTYMGQTDYEFHDKTYTKYRPEGECRRLSILTQKQEWNNRWNYTPEDFEALYNGSYMIPHMMCGEAPSPEIFEIMKLLYPNAIYGHLDLENKRWVKDEINDTTIIA